MIIAKALIARVSLVVMVPVFGLASGIALAQTWESDAGGVTLTTLHTFTGADGVYPEGVLVHGA